MKQNKKIKIALLFGGPSEEHDVSVNSAAQVKKYLDKTKYEVLPVKISKQGLWPKGLSPYNLKSKIDTALIIMHGKFGEDGTVQAILEAEKVRYTGSGVLASSLAMDKFRSSMVANAGGINIPYAILTNGNIDFSKLSDKVVIKPNTGGSSVGVKIISKPELKKLLSNNKLSKDILIQNYISGREFTVSVLDNQTLPVIEIIPKAKFYDFASKYKIGGSEHIIPANISNSLTKKLQEQANLIHNLLGCKTMSRSDFLVEKTGKIYYLETNTIPGMTSTSLLPQAAASVGISFPELLDIVINSSLS